MNQLIPQIIQELQAGNPLALATIFTRHGSAPRTAGAEMIIRMDNSISGTIGGGQLEAKTMVAARDVLASKKHVVKEFFLTGSDAASTDMICGGNQEILVEYLDPGDEILMQQLKLAAEVKNQRKHGWWLTRMVQLSTGDISIEHGLAANTEQTLISQDWAQKINLNWSNKILSWKGSELQVKLDDIRATSHFSSENETWIIDPIDILGTVYLFGGGHVSQQTAIITHLVGFRTVVIDDRPEFITTERFPDAEERVLVADFNHAFEQLKLDPMSFLVIVTRGHLSDHTVLRQALKSDAVYIGMIGSKRKNQTILDALAQEGFSRDLLAQVYAPIGVDIDAETPEEIAVSIAAELIKVRASLLK